MRCSVPTAVELQLRPLRARLSSGTLRAKARSQGSNLQAELLQIQFSPKGDLLAASSTLGIARLWNAATGAELTTIQTGRQVVFNPHGDLVLAATSDNAAQLLETDGTELKKLVGHRGRIAGAAFSTDGQLVATASLDHTARIWSVKDGSTIAVLRGHGDELTQVAFSPDGETLLTASRDGTVRIWSVRDGAEKVVLRGARRRSEYRGIQSQRSLCPNRFNPGRNGATMDGGYRTRDGSVCQSGGGE